MKEKKKKKRFVSNIMISFPIFVARLYSISEDVFTIKKSPILNNDQGIISHGLVIIDSTCIHFLIYQDH